MTSDECTEHSNDRSEFAFEGSSRSLLENVSIDGRILTSTGSRHAHGIANSRSEWLQESRKRCGIGTAQQTRIIQFSIYD